MKGACHLLAGLLLGLAGNRLGEGATCGEAPHGRGLEAVAHASVAVPLGGDPVHGDGRPGASARLSRVLGTEPGPRRAVVRTRLPGGQDIQTGPSPVTGPPTVVVHIHLGAWPEHLDPRSGRVPVPVVLALGETGPAFRAGGSSWRGQDCAGGEGGP